MKSTLLSRCKTALLAIASVALLTPVARGATINPQLDDLILGFYATGAPGNTLNVEADLGPISQFHGLAPGQIVPLSCLNVLDLQATYGTNWYQRSDVFWGAVATTGRFAVGPEGQPAGTLWATAPNCAPAWNRGSSSAQKNASKIIEAMFTAAGPSSLFGATSTANSSCTAILATSGADSWSARDNQGGTASTSFTYFNPSVDNFEGTNVVVSQLYELQPGSGVGTYLGDLILTDQGLSFRAASPPSAVCKPSVVLAADPASCTATATVDQIDGGSMGFCFSLSLDNAGPYSVGQTPVTLTVTDGAGETNSCTTTVTVVGAAPSLTCPLDVNLTADPGGCSATGSWGMPTATGCDAPNISVVCTPASGTPFTVGSTPVTCVASNLDAGGLTASCTFHVIVKNLNPPNVPVLPDVNGQCSAAVPVATTTDACGNLVTGTTGDPLTYNSQGTFLVHWTFTDASGNSSAATQTVIVKNTTAPVVPALATVTGQCSATVTAPTTVGACGDAVTGTTSDPLTYNSQGTFTVTWTFTDAQGNSSTGIQTVIVKNTTAPVVPALATVTGQCSASVTAPTTTGNCGDAVTGTTSDSLTYNSQGTFLVHWTFTDAQGNSSTDTQTVIVKNTTPPAVPVLANVTGQCSATVSAVPTTVGACGDAVTGTTSDSLTYSSQGTFLVHWTFTDAQGNSSHGTQTVIVKNTTPPAVPALPDVTGQCSATVSKPTTVGACGGMVTGTTSDPLTYNSQGTFLVHWTFTDAQGNSSTGTQTVIVNNTTPPAVPVLANVTGQCSATVTKPTTVGACGDAVTGMTSDPLSYTSQGTFTVHWTFTDAQGNSSTGTQTVIVKDTTPPTVHCPGNQSVIVPTGTNFATVTYPAPTVNDNCSGASASYDIPSGSQFPVGTTTVTATATDVAGNTATCTFTVTVTQQAPCGTLAALIAKVNATTSLRAGDKQNLLHKLSNDVQNALNQAAQKYAQGNINDALNQQQNALHQLQDFVHQVNDLYKGHHMSLADRNSVLDCSQVLANALIGPIGNLSTAATVTLVNATSLSAGDKNNLLGKLQHAQQGIAQANASLAQSNWNDCMNHLRNDVYNQLVQFMQQVTQFQQQGKLSAAQAAALNASAQAVYTPFLINP